MSMCPADMTMDIDIDTMWCDSWYLDRLFIGFILAARTDEVTKYGFDDVFEENIVHSFSGI